MAEGWGTAKKPTSKRLKNKSR